jgi:hypothetical protein
VALDVSGDSRVQALLATGAVTAQGTTQLVGSLLLGSATSGAFTVARPASAAGAGRSTLVLGQAGAAGSVGGSVVLDAGTGATGGTVVIGGGLGSQAVSIGQAGRTLTAQGSVAVVGVLSARGRYACASWCSLGPIDD